MSPKDCHTITVQNIIHRKLVNRELLTQCDQLEYHVVAKLVFPQDHSDGCVTNLSEVCSKEQR